MNIPRRRILHLAAGAASPADDGEAQARWRSRAGVLPRCPGARQHAVVLRPIATSRAAPSGRDPWPELAAALRADLDPPQL